MSSEGGRVVWLSGHYLDEDRARVPATSRLVTQGHGLFETLRVVRGVAPLVDRHARRLAGACAELGLAGADRDWGGIIAELSRRNGLTRGVARITVSPELALATLGPLPRGLARERREGVALRSVRLQRAVPHLKTTSRLALDMAERDAGGEALLVATGGRALESSRSNFFALQGDTLVTAAARSVLPGIARALAIELARELGLRVRLRAPRLAERPRWEGAFLTNAVRGLRPLRAIDELRPPPPSPLLRELQRALDRSMGLR